MWEARTPGSSIDKSPADVLSPRLFLRPHVAFWFPEDDRTVEQEHFGACCFDVGTSTCCQLGFPSD